VTAAVPSPLAAVGASPPGRLAGAAGPAAAVLDGRGRRHAGRVTAADVVAGARLTCHGIVPAALRAGDHPGWWATVAPALESACNAGRDQRWGTAELAAAIGAASRELRRPVPDEVVRRLAAGVLAAGVRGYDQGVEAVLRGWTGSGWVGSRPPPGAGPGPCVRATGARCGSSRTGT
jgi:hypothetical protein